MSPSTDPREVRKQIAAEVIARTGVSAEVAQVAANQIATFGADAADAMGPTVIPVGERAVWIDARAAILQVFAKLQDEAAQAARVAA